MDKNRQLIRLKNYDREYLFGKIVVGVSFMKPEIKMIIIKSNRHMGLMNQKTGLINQTPTLGEYIINNLLMWDWDRNNPMNINTKNNFNLGVSLN